ncbi:MAG: hypothetical protein ACUZ8E_13930 [Candidatus Anammoxibacter sp.]
MKRLNITLPDELCLKLKALPNKSRFIAETLNDKFDKEEQQMLDDLLIEGYKSSNKDDNKLNKEWENITLEGWE